MAKGGYIVPRAYKGNKLVHPELPSGIVAWWDARGVGKVNNILHDVSGNNRHLTLSGFGNSNATGYNYRQDFMSWTVSSGGTISRVRDKAIITQINTAGNAMLYVNSGGIGTVWSMKVKLTGIPNGEYVYFGILNMPTEPLTFNKDGVYEFTYTHSTSGTANIGFRTSWSGACNFVIEQLSEGLQLNGTAYGRNQDMPLQNDFTIICDRDWVGDEPLTFLSKSITAYNGEFIFEIQDNRTYSFGNPSIITGVQSGVSWQTATSYNNQVITRGVPAISAYNEILLGRVRASDTATRANALVRQIMLFDRTLSKQEIDSVISYMKSEQYSGYIRGGIYGWWADETNLGTVGAAPLASEIQNHANTTIATNSVLSTVTVGSKKELIDASDAGGWTLPNAFSQKINNGSGATYEFCVTKSLSVAGRRCTIFGPYGGTGTTGLNLELTSANFIRLYHNLSTTTDIAVTGHPITPGVPFSVSVTIERIEGRIKCYLNGALIYNAQNNVYKAKHPSSNYLHYIGRDARGDITSWQGTYNATRFYDRVLTEEEVLHNYNLDDKRYITPLDKALVQHYDGLLTNGTGVSQSNSSWKDLIGSNDATLEGDAEWLSNGLNLVPSISYADFVGTTTPSYTYMVTFRPQLTGLHPRLFDGGTLYGCLYLSSTNAYRYAYNSHGVNTPFGSIAPDANTLNHVTITYNSVSKVINCYHNGTLVGTLTGTSASASSASALLGNSEQQTFTRQLNGVIHNFRRYNRVLTPSEVQQVSTEDLLRFADVPVPIALPSMQEAWIDAGLATVQGTDAQGNITWVNFNTDTVDVPFADTSTLTSTQDMFWTCPITSIPELDFSNVVLSTSMFAFCGELRYVPDINMPLCVTANAMFMNCYNLASKPNVTLAPGCDVTDMWTGTPHG